MLSIEQVFNNVQLKNPRLSSFICFSEALENRRLDQKTTRKAFNKLVEKDDYNPKEKSQILEFLYRHAGHSEE